MDDRRSRVGERRSDTTKISRKVPVPNPPNKESTPGGCRRLKERVTNPVATHSTDVVSAPEDTRLRRGCR